MSTPTPQNTPQHNRQHNRQHPDGNAHYEQLPAIPDLSKVMRSIMVGMVPVVGTSHVANADPTTRLEVRGVRIDPAKLAAYTSATGLRLGNEVPPTYFFVLGFPLTMELMNRADFPFAPVGAVHVANVIEQARAPRIDESFTIRVHAEKLRPHRKGLLIDVITQVVAEADTNATGGTSTPGDDSTAPVWTQTATFLAQGARFAKGAPTAITTRGEDDARPLPRPELPKTAANAQWRFTREDVRAYVTASGDSNPIHTSNLGAKAFGFPGVIAHGMFSAAATLRLLEGSLRGPLRYTVEFHKPVVVPARVAAWAQTDGETATSLQLRSAAKPEKLHLNARVERLS